MVHIYLIYKLVEVFYVNYNYIILHYSSIVRAYHYNIDDFIQLLGII